MKFIAFNVREDERRYFEEWSKENGIEVSLKKEEITPDNVSETVGYDAVIGLQTGLYPDNLFKELSDANIKVFSVRNVGVDNINLDDAKQNGVAVTNVPAYSPSAIAEFSVTQLLQLLRNQNLFRKRMAKQDYRWAPFVGKELGKMTVGVMGTGRIGRAAIQIYKGFGAKVIAYDPFHNPELEKEGIYVEKEDLLKKADVITLHMPATDDDYHFINEKTISMMKDGAYIVNTARGALIDTSALVEALKSGKLAGAALDTYENEASIFNHDLEGQEIEDETFKELIKLDNVVVSPHIAFYTNVAVENMVKISLDSAKEVIETGTSSTLVK